MTNPTGDTPQPPRQRSARNDAAMRDGDGSHGNPYETAGDEYALDSDNDVGDTTRADTSITESMIDNVLDGKTGRQTLSLDPEAFDRMADQHSGPDIEAEDDEEQYVADAADAGLPIASYEDLSIADIAEQASGLSRAELQMVLDHERSHRNRGTLIARLEKLTPG